MINRQVVKTDTRIFLALGSNLGDRRANLAEAIDRIEESGLEVVRRSSIYETEPVGYKDQDWFMNQVIEVRIGTERQLKMAGADNPDFKEFQGRRDISAAQADLAEALLGNLLDIENRLGRRRSFKNAPRVIDIDLLLVGNLRLDLQRQAGAALDLTLPHPRMVERRFVLEPLCEIAGDLIDPVSEKPFIELLLSLKDHSAVRRLTG